MVHTHDKLVFEHILALEAMSVLKRAFSEGILPTV
jgi:hypothetical protein